MTSLAIRFGANVRHHRKAANMTQSALAEAIDLSEGMVGKVERGEVSSSFETIERIASALQVDEMALFGSGFITSPAGPRGRALQNINRVLAKMNDAELERAEAILSAFKGGG